jgi:hypothetical protein
MRAVGWHGKHRIYGDRVIHIQRGLLMFQCISPHTMPFTIDIISIYSIITSNFSDSQ